MIPHTQNYLIRLTYIKASSNINKNWHTCCSFTVLYLLLVLFFPLIFSFYKYRANDHVCNVYFTRIKSIYFSFTIYIHHMPHIYNWFRIKIEQTFLELKSTGGHLFCFCIVFSLTICETNILLCSGFPKGAYVTLLHSKVFLLLKYFRIRYIRMVKRFRWLCFALIDDFLYKICGSLIYFLFGGWLIFVLNDFSNNLLLNLRNK